APGPDVRARLEGGLLRADGGDARRDRAGAPGLGDAPPARARPPARRGEPDLTGEESAMEEPQPDVALRSSWKIKPMPSEVVRLPFEKAYSAEDAARIRRGLIPREM